MPSIKAAPAALIQLAYGSARVCLSEYCHHGQSDTFTIIILPEISKPFDETVLARGLHGNF